MSLTSKVNTIIPKYSKQRVTSKKFESEHAIISLNEVQQLKDHKFETQEDIEIEMESNSMQNNQPSQKKKNPMVNCQLKRNKKQIFYRCPQICIQPTKKRLKTIQLHEQISQKINSLKCEKNQFLRVSQQKKKESKRKQIFRDSKIINIISQYKSEIKRTKFKTEKRQQQVKQQSKQQEIMQSEPKRIKGIDQFHITFETDEITQCCL